MNHKRIVVNGRYSDAFVYVISGGCTYQFDDGVKFSVQAGDVFYLPCQSQYTRDVCRREDYHVIFCDFTFSKVSLQGAKFAGQYLKNANSLFTKLLNVYRSPLKYKTTECMSVLYAIYNSLQRETEHVYLEKEKKEIIADSKKYMEENFNNSELSIPILAQRIGISEVYFRKLFKSMYAISPLKYLTSLRLKNAITLMEYPVLSLEECALQSGFSSLQYFCRIFKKEFGISPGKYRKK